VQDVQVALRSLFTLAKWFVRNESTFCSCGTIITVSIDENTARCSSSEEYIAVVGAKCCAALATDWLWAGALRQCGRDHIVHPVTLFSTRFRFF